MKITDFIAQHLIESFEGGNWTEVSLKDVLDNVDYLEATTVTKASHNSIASLLHHLTFYNDVVSMRIMGIDPVIDETNGFDLPPVKNENEWQRLKDAAYASAHNLAEKIRNFPEERLREETLPGLSTYYKTFHGVAEHIHYHVGQILIIKRLAKASLMMTAKSNSL